MPAAQAQMTGMGETSELGGWRGAVETRHLQDATKKHFKDMFSADFPNGLFQSLRSPLYLCHGR